METKKEKWFECSIPPCWGRKSGSASRELFAQILLALSGSELLCSVSLLPWCLWWRLGSTHWAIARPSLFLSFNSPESVWKPSCHCVPLTPASPSVFMQDPDYTLLSSKSQSSRQSQWDLNLGMNRTVQNHLCWQSRCRETIELQNGQMWDHSSFQESLGKAGEIGWNSKIRLPKLQA